MMHFLSHIFIFSYLLASGSAAVLDQRAACSADNCARAVTGTNGSPPLATKRADCSSFLLYTVTPDAVTVTATASVTTPTTTTSIVTATVTSIISTTTTSLVENDVTSTSTEFDTASVTPTNTVTSTVTTDVYVPERLKNRDGGLGIRAITVAPTHIPTYASACSGTARYSSACLCFGVVISTTTITAVTSTVTATSTGATTIESVSTAVVFTSTTTIIVTSTTFTSIFPAEATTTAATVTEVAVTNTATTTVTDSFTCPSQVVVNGGFESGALTPFTFESHTSFFGNPCSITIVDNPTNAHSGTYYASINADTSYDVVDFTLSQTVTVCAGAPYSLNLFTSSVCPSSGACSCILAACVNGYCHNFDPPGGARPGAGVQLTFPGTTGGATTATISIGLADEFCERQQVNFDDISLTLL